MTFTSLNISFVVLIWLWKCLESSFEVCNRVNSLFLFGDEIEFYHIWNAILNRCSQGCSRSNLLKLQNRFVSETIGCFLQNIGAFKMNPPAKHSLSTKTNYLLNHFQSLKGLIWNWHPVIWIEFYIFFSLSWSQLFSLCSSRKRWLMRQLKVSVSPGALLSEAQSPRTSRRRKCCLR